MKLERHAKIIELIGRVCHRDTGRAGSPSERGRIPRDTGYRFPGYPGAEADQDADGGRTAALCGVPPEAAIRWGINTVGSSAGWLLVHGHGTEYSGGQDGLRYGYGGGGGAGRLDWQEIVGCIAGDDTIFCAVRTVDDTMLVMERCAKP